MLIFRTKISVCVPCFMFISPLLCGMLLIRVTQAASSYSNISIIMNDNTKQASNINSSHEENSIFGEIRHGINMNSSDTSHNSSIDPDLSYPLTTSKDSTSWSDQLWDQLQYNMKNTAMNFSSISDFDMFRVPFYHNYEDYFPTLNDSAMDKVDLYDELNNYNGINDFYEQPESDKNMTDVVSSLYSLLSIVTNSSSAANTSISLSDIILSHHLSSIIRQENKSKNNETRRQLDQSKELYLPPWKNLTKLQKSAILKSALGEPQKYSNSTVIGLTTYYGAILSVGIPGNALTLLIILTNSYMRTAPNIFLLNVALADLLTLTLVVPIEVKMLFKSYPWPFGEIGCSAATTICELLTHVLIVTMIAFSLERYFAICHPLKPSLQSGKLGTAIIILFVWSICLILSLCWTVYSKVEYMFYSTAENPHLRVTQEEEQQYYDRGFVKIDESAICVVSPSSVTKMMAVMTVLTTIGLYILPILILPLVYSRIAKALKESENYSQGGANNGNTSRNRKTVVRMQMAVIACFLICWTPYHVQRIMFVILSRTDKWSPHLLRVQEILHIVSGCCYFLSSAINPFLYSLLSKRFRRGFHDLTQKMIKNWRNRSSTASRDNQNNRHALAQASTLPNNVSFSFKNRRVNNRTAIKRHFDLPFSSVIQNDNDLNTHQRFEHEMHSIGNQKSRHSHGYKCSSDDFSTMNSNHAKAEKLKCEDVDKIASLLRRNKKKLNCKYKVVFKSHSNHHDTTLIVNADRVEKNIPRCSGVNDLRTVGKTSTSLPTSSVAHMNRSQMNGRNDNFYSVTDERSNKRKNFLSSLSCQTYREV